MKFKKGSMATRSLTLLTLLEMFANDTMGKTINYHYYVSLICIAQVAERKVWNRSISAFLVAVDRRKPKF